MPKQYNIVQYNRLIIHYNYHQILKYCFGIYEAQAVLKNRRRAKSNLGVNVNRDFDILALMLTSAHENSTF